MNSLKTLFFLAFLVTVLVPSCTVKKRLHRKGYYVEWRTNPHGKGQSNPEKLVLAEKLKTSDSILLLSAEEHVLVEETKPEFQENVAETLTISEEEIFPLVASNDSPEENLESVPAVKHSNYQPTDNRKSLSEEPETHPLAVAALILGILGILLPLVGFLFSLFAWILGKLAQDEIISRPDKYKGLKMAKAGKILGIIGMCLLALFLLWFLVAFIILLAAF